MLKKTIPLLIAFIFLLHVSVVSADIDPGQFCKPSADQCKDGIDTTTGKNTSFSCQPSTADPNQFICKPSSTSSIFGKINPPPELQPFINKGGAGAGGISLFLNNSIVLIYIVAGMVFMSMMLWGAMQWTMSGGDKEAVAAARNRIIHALIGIVLFAVAFAVIKLVGTFTGFKFF